MIPEYKLGWVAGVLDYKGTIIRKANSRRATPQLVLMVESTNSAVVAELSQLTGGAPEPRDNRLRKEWMSRGCKVHCPEAHVHHEGPGEWHLPPVSRWTVTGAGMAIVLFNVIPYMVTDKGMQQAMDDSLAHLVTSGRGVGAVRASVVRLAELGWNLPPQIKDKISQPVSEEAARLHHKENA
jgi:hypothetical protein